MTNGLKSSDKIIFVEDDPLYSALIKRLHDEAPRLFRPETELVTIQSMSMLRHVLSAMSAKIIIMDLSLPDSPQRETIETVGRERKNWPPVFAVTGDERMEVRNQCLAVGFVGFAIKKHVLESPNFFFAQLYNEYIKRLDHG